ncbi:DUF4136 domain-containing protein [Aestuariicella hydrocarbonica]|uniref:DUF4136 domain-containing protein n=1 Tax=Pseudomaricurvus hydrocarbonicus TaxID=1470433 RepID=A0A9E5JWK0_9GAMM|nr:DUF4136 domain-containing protein [Aestuariicella hydrocarbonica]NHO66604.1 DUF4136 domain-containing protein [Aestuariicella hydrocarbonica]
MRLLLPLLLATLLSACTHTYYKEMKTSVDELSAMKTFMWENPNTDTGNSNEAVFDRAFEKSFTAQLHNKGYRSVTENPDFLVDYRISVVPSSITPTSISEEHGGWRIGENGEPVYEGWNRPEGRSELIERGLVILTITRTLDNAIVWQAGAARTVSYEDSKGTFEGHASSSAKRIGRDLPKAK